MREEEKTSRLFFSKTQKQQSKTTNQAKRTSLGLNRHKLSSTRTSTHANAATKRLTTQFEFSAAGKAIEQFKTN